MPQSATNRRSVYFFVTFVCWQLSSLLLLIQLKDVAGEMSSTEKVKHSLEFVGSFILRRHFRASNNKDKQSLLLKQDGISVVGAGFPRTGTKSIEKALQMMGHEIYDIRASAQYNHGDRWAQAAIQWKDFGNLTEIELLLQDIEELGYTATLDNPTYLFAPAIAQLRPNSKVLLSVRDSVDQWYESFKVIYRLFVPLFACRPWKWISPNSDYLVINMVKLGNIPEVELTYPERLARPLPWYETLLPHDIPQIREGYKRHYIEFQQLVHDTVPPERLLVYNVKQGWEPWIPFFELQDDASDVIDFTEPFPHVNERQVLVHVQNILNIISIGFPLWLLFAVWLGYYLIVKPIVVLSNKIFAFSQNSKITSSKASNKDKKND